jgi:hypothetical protein
MLEGTAGFRDTDFVVGDQAYALGRQLLTPYANPQAPEHFTFNTVQSFARRCVEQCFGVMKVQLCALALPPPNLSTAP